MTIAANQNLETTRPETTTSAHRVAPPVPLKIYRTRTIEEVIEEARDLVEQTGHYRNVSEVISDDLADVHHRAFIVQLDLRTSKLGRRAPSELLDELAAFGFGWSDLARMFSVSIPALRRWRRGESPTGEHRRDIAKLVAVTEILREDHLVADIASWMEMPIVSDAPITAIDLYSAGKFSLLFDLASDHQSPEAVMTLFDPNWRQSYASDFEIENSADGMPSIHLRNDAAR